MKFLAELRRRPRAYFAGVALVVLATMLAGVAFKQRAEVRRFVAHRVLGIAQQPSPENLRLADDLVLARMEETSVWAEILRRYDGGLSVTSFKAAYERARHDCNSAVLDAFGVVPCGETIATVPDSSLKNATPAPPPGRMHKVSFAVTQPDGQISLDLAIEGTETIDRIEVVADSEKEQEETIQKMPARADYCYAENFDVLKGTYYFLQHQSEHDKDFWHPRANWQGDSSPGVLRLNAPFYHDFNNMDGLGYYQPMGGIVMGYWQLNYAPSAMRAVLSTVFPYTKDFIEGNREDGFGYQGPNFFSGGARTCAKATCDSVSGGTQSIRRGKTSRYSSLATRQKSTGH